jgi:hypothetical protein
MLLAAICRYLTGRFAEAEAMAAEARAAGRERHDSIVFLWGLLVLIESRRRTDAGDPLIGEWLEEAKQLLTREVPGIEVVRAHVNEASQHLAAGALLMPGSRSGSPPPWLARPFLPSLYHRSARWHPRGLLCAG